MVVEAIGVVRLSKEGIKNLGPGLGWGWGVFKNGKDLNNGENRLTCAQEYCVMFK